jgi:hypothetical protein
MRKRLERPGIDPRPQGLRRVVDRGPEGHGFASGMVSECAIFGRHICAIFGRR